MGDLHTSRANPSDPRPFQTGQVEGTKNHRPATVSKEWLVDTGASISALTRSNADQFDLTPLGGTASGTTGGGGTPPVRRTSVPTPTRLNRAGCAGTWRTAGGRRGRRSYRPAGWAAARSRRWPPG